MVVDQECGRGTSRDGELAIAAAVGIVVRLEPAQTMLLMSMMRLERDDAHGVARPLLLLLVLPLLVLVVTRSSRVLLRFSPYPTYACRSTSASDMPACVQDPPAVAGVTDPSLLGLCEVPLRVPALDVLGRAWFLLRTAAAGFGA